MTTGNKFTNHHFRPNFVIAGFQKCATTWLYRCLSEHPDILMSSQHMVHFFDIHFEKGPDWYFDFFDQYKGEKCIGDSTVTYIKHPDFASRLKQFNPETKIILCLRNPIDRAFSHYWHEKKKGRFNFTFEEYETNYDLFETWIRTGFYDTYIEQLLMTFDRKQLAVFFSEDFEASPNNELERLFQFLEVDSTFIPKAIHQRANRANRAEFLPTNNPIKKLLKMTHSKREQFPVDLTEYKNGLPIETKNKLIQIYSPHVDHLSSMLSRDLSSWLK